MKKILKAISVLTITLLISSNSLYAQNTPKIKKDKNLDTLLELKLALEVENNLINGYTIQLQNGDINKVKQKRKEYEQTKAAWPATIEYENPNFKLWVGNFETRIEADRALLQLSKNFPSAFILKPERK